MALLDHTRLEGLDLARARLHGARILHAQAARAHGWRRTASTVPEARAMAPRGTGSRLTRPRVRLHWRDYSLPQQLTAITVLASILAILLNVVLVGPFFDGYFMSQQGASVGQQTIALGRCCADPSGPLLSRSHAELAHGLEISLGATPARRAVVMTPLHVRFTSPMPNALERALLARLRADLSLPPSNLASTPGWDRVGDQIMSEVRLPAKTTTTLFGVGVAKQTGVALLLAEPQSIAQAERQQVSAVVTLAGTVAMTLALLAIVLAAQRVMRPVRNLTSAANGIAAGDYREAVALGGAAEVRELALALNAMMEEARRQRRIEHDLLVDISQEISAPLKTIRGYTDALVGGVIHDETTRLAMLHSIGDETTRLRRFSTDLLDLALLETGKVTPQYESETVDHLLTRLRERVEATAQRASVKLTIQAVPGLPPLRTDALLVEQALVNLVENAVY